MAGPIRDLFGLLRHGGAVHAECRSCGRVAIFAIDDLREYLRRKRKTTQWPDFAQHLRCAVCGARGPRVTWQTDRPPPDDDPPPPRPRFIRAAIPTPVRPASEWEKARERRRRRGAG